MGAIFRGGSREQSRPHDGERIAIQLLVDYRVDGAYFFDFCSALSETGLFVVSAFPQAVGTRMELTFTLPDSKETITTCAWVEWVQAPSSKKGNIILGGMGVQFAAMDEEQRKGLREFVRRYNMRTRKKIA
jgi:uncharacterized protein (TIGR02266 family)